MLRKALSGLLAGACARRARRRPDRGRGDRQAPRGPRRPRQDQGRQVHEDDRQDDDGPRHRSPDRPGDEAAGERRAGHHVPGQHAASRPTTARRAGASAPWAPRRTPSPCPPRTSRTWRSRPTWTARWWTTKAKGHAVELMGKEKVEGSDAYKLKVTLKNGDIRYIYIDADSYLELKTEAKRTIRGSEVETRERDRRLQGGGRPHPAPHHPERRQGPGRRSRRSRSTRSS